MKNRLYFYSEAKCFEEAIPIGNGKIGAMVYGNCLVDKLSVNEDTIWSGKDEEYKAPDNAAKAYKKAKKLVEAGKIIDAEKVLADDFLGMWSQIYLPLGNIYVKYNHDNIKNYSRTLNMRNGVAEVSYHNDEKHYRRTYFASHSAECLAMKVECSCKNSISMEIEAESQLMIENKYVSDNKMVILGKCPEVISRTAAVGDEDIVYSSDTIKFAQAIKVDNIGGELTKDGNRIIVKDADSVVIYMCVKTTYEAKDKYYDECISIIDKYSHMDFCDVYDEHVRDFSKYFDRVSFDITDTENDDDICKRLREFDGDDKGLYELMFQFGRYLLISSSRPGSQATNLQGIWNERLRPPWRSNYTVNINTQMNYWLSPITNLSEFFVPLIDLVQKIRKTGRKVAKDYYNANGFVCHHNIDLWGHSNPVGMNTNGILYAFWNMSSGWFACQLYDYYEYTLDKNAFVDVIYPTMKEAAEFYLDIMSIDEDGYYIISPSTSPENKYKRGDELLSLSKTTTMTMCIFKELLHRLILAHRILGIKNDFSQKVENVYQKAYPIKLTEDGRIREWAYDEEETDERHRHISHLFSLYPGCLINDYTPELKEACKKTLEVRGDDGTGWSLGWKINMWAILKDGDRALKLIKRQLKYAEPESNKDIAHQGGTYPNLFDAHPPFQIDGNFAFTAGISNMLLQSSMQRIEVLPALPKSWSKGKITGLVAKGGIEVSVVWDNNSAKTVELLATKADCVREIIIGEKINNVHLYRGVPMTLEV